MRSLSLYLFLSPAKSLSLSFSYLCVDVSRKLNFIPFFHSDKCRQVLKTHEPVYQAIWVDNIDFDEVLISPAMIQDHMPDTVLAALNKVSRCVWFEPKMNISYARMLFHPTMCVILCTTFYYTIYSSLFFPFMFFLTSYYFLVIIIDLLLFSVW